MKDKKPFRAKGSFLIETQDILSDLEEKKGSSLFLGKYTMREIIAVLKKRGFDRDARKRGLWPLDYELDSYEYPPLQRLIIYYREKNPENLIVDLKIREALYKVNKLQNFPFEPLEYKFLMLEWLTLQNPLLSFSGKGAPLPGQKHPGLNLGKKIIDLFVYLARLMRKDGLLAFPAYFHNSLLFSRAFHFLNPDKEAEIIAIRKSFPHVSFKTLAWIVHWNCLLKSSGQAYEWEAEEQVYPLHRSLHKYFASRVYKNAVRNSTQTHHYSIDWECYQKKLRKAA